MRAAASLKGGLGAVLAWAAGAASDAPPTQLGELDEGELFDLIDAHGLGARFAARLDREGQRFGPGVQAAARELRSSVNRHLLSHAAAVTELSATLGDARALVILKGMAAYQLTGRPELMRCGDVDLLVRDGSSAEVVLRSLGYRRTRASFGHELGEFTRADIEIDLHRFFPIHAYPESLRAADMRPDRHPAQWKQGDDLAARCVTYKRAIGEARTGQPPERGVLVPSPELQVLILCGHAFMNYTNLWSISHRRKPYVRLAELADVRDLVQHPTFDHNRFTALADEFDGRDAVEWTAAAGRSLLGIDPLPGYRVGEMPTLDGSRFPRCLWWRFWADLPIDSDTLIDRFWLRMNRVVAALGATKIGWHGERTDRYGTVDAPGSRVLARTIALPNADLVPFFVELKRTAEHLTVHVRAHRGSADETERVRVDLGDRAVEWIWPAGSDEGQAVGEAEAAFCSRGDTYEVTLAFPAQGPASSSPKDVALLVGITRTAPPDDDVTASTLVPLSIHDEGHRL